jgi:hypothetical protein
MAPSCPATWGTAQLTPADAAGAGVWPAPLIRGLHAPSQRHTEQLSRLGKDLDDAARSIHSGLSPRLSGLCLAASSPVCLASNPPVATAKATTATRWASHGPGRLVSGLLGVQLGGGLGQPVAGRLCCANVLSDIAGLTTTSDL